MSRKVYSFILVLIFSFIVCVSNVSANKISEANIGDYIKMTPTSTNYTISKDLTGYTSDQTINPSELNLWRVIRKNDDGTVDVVSEYVSSTKVYFYGSNGYLNLVGELNNIAAQYTNSKYVQSTRHMGFNGQIEKCMELSTTSCPTDTGYEVDNNLVEVATGTIVGNTANGIAIAYFLASRYIISNSTSSEYTVRYVDNNGKIVNSTLFFSNDTDGVDSEAIRPILTLKADIDLPIPNEYKSKALYDLDNPNESNEKPIPPQESTEEDNKGQDNVKDDQNNSDDENKKQEISSKDEIKNPNTGNFLICILIFSFIILVTLVLNINKSRKIFKL